MRTYLPRVGGGCNKVKIGVYSLYFSISLLWLEFIFELAVILTRVKPFTGPNKPLIRVNSLPTLVTHAMSFYGGRLLIPCPLSP